jgi:hypothetical protein
VENLTTYCSQPIQQILFGELIMETMEIPSFAEVIGHRQVLLISVKQLFMVHVLMFTVL